MYTWISAWISWHFHRNHHHHHHHLHHHHHHHHCLHHHHHRFPISILIMIIPLMTIMKFVFHWKSGNNECYLMRNLSIGTAPQPNILHQYIQSKQLQKMQYIKKNNGNKFRLWAINHLVCSPTVRLMSFAVSLNFSADLSSLQTWNSMNKDCFSFLSLSEFTITSSPHLPTPAEKLIGNISFDDAH